MTTAKPTKTSSKSTSSTTSDRAAADRAAAAADRADRHAKRSASAAPPDPAPVSAIPVETSAPGTLNAPVDESPAPHAPAAESVASSDTVMADGDDQTEDKGMPAPESRAASPTPSLVDPGSPLTPTPSTHALSRPATPSEPEQLARTPTPRPSPRRDEFPPLESPPFETVLSHAQRRKAKGKGRAKQSTAPTSSSAPAPPAPSSPPSSLFSALDDDTARYDEEADIARAKALSLGLRTDVHNGAGSSRRAGSGSQSSRRPADPTDTTGGSPQKRQRANVGGQSIPRREPSRDPTPPPNPPLYDTADGNPPRGSYTPTPEGGYRPFYGVTQSSLFRNHPARQRQQWDAVPHPKIIATIAGGNGDRMQTTPALRELIGNRFNINLSDISIGTPGLADGPGPDPVAWLIAGLHIDHAQTLLDMRALVSDTISVYFHAYDPAIMGFGGTFHGFTLPMRERDLARAIIADAVAADPSIARFVRAHRDAYPAFMTNDEALAHFAESLWVQPIQLLSPRGQFTAWNVYFDSPTNREDHFATLRTLFDRLIIDTPFNGQGRMYHRPLRCTICPGIDHPTNICPMHEVAGYVGPTAETIGALLDFSREVLNPRATKKPGRDGNKAKPGNGKGKGKDRDDRKGGGDRRRGN